MGVGNRLLLDDGIGSCFAEALASFDPPGWLEVIDGGIGGLGLLDYMEGKDLLFLVDALSGDDPPGSVKLLRVNPDALEPQEALRLVVEVGSHGIVPEILLASASALGVLPPESYVLGVVPLSVDLGEGLTPRAVEGCVRALVLLREELARRGLELPVDERDFREKLVETCGLREPRG